MSDVSVRPARVGPWLLALAGGGLLAASGVAAGLFYFNYTPEKIQTPAPPPDNGVLDARVHEFCSHCHAYPPPDTFPRSAWKYEVEQAFQFYELYAPPIHPPPIDAVVKHFEDRAPTELPPAPIERATSDLPVRFEPVRIPGPPDTPAPVISNVNLVHLYDDHRLDVLATDMRSGQVMVLRPYVDKPAWKVLATL